jgi:hypothetical protein
MFMERERMWELTQKICKYLAERNDEDDLETLDCVEQITGDSLLEDFFESLTLFANEFVATVDKPDFYKAIGLSKDEIEMFDDYDDEWEDVELEDDEDGDETPNINIKEATTVPSKNTWSYPLEEIQYIFDQIMDGARENGETFVLYAGRLYESYETQVGL